jgi:hypothetical protein
MAEKFGMNYSDMVKLVKEDPRNKTSHMSETALKLQFPMYNLFIEFPTLPEASIYSKVTFPAYMSEAINDTYSPSYNDAGPVFGRMDPIPVYSRTTRTMKFGFNIPANSIDDAREIRKKLDIIAKNTYPTFELTYQGRKVIRKPPLIRVKFGNIICNPEDENKGLLGYLNGAISISHDLASGVFTTWPGQEIYAKKYSLSIGFNVLHEFTPGHVVAPEDLSTGSGVKMIFPGVSVINKATTPPSGSSVPNNASVQNNTNPEEYKALA